MCNKYSNLIILIILSLNIFNGSCTKDSSDKTKETTNKIVIYSDSEELEKYKEKLLIDKIYFVIKTIREKNIDSLVSLLHDEIEIEVAVDYYQSKDELKKELISKGEIYNYLFDTKGLRKDLKKHDINDKNICIREFIINNKPKKIFLHILKDKPEMVIANLHWINESSQKMSLDKLIFSFYKNDWYLIGLNFTNF